MKYIVCSVCGKTDSPTKAVFENGNLVKLANVGTSNRMYCKDCCSKQSHVATMCRACCLTGHGTKIDEVEWKPYIVQTPVVRETPKPFVPDLGEWWRDNELFLQYCNKREKMEKDGPFVGQIISVLDWNDVNAGFEDVLHPTHTRTGVPCFKVGTKDVLSTETMEPQWIVYAARWGLVAYYDKPLKKGSKVKVTKKTETSVTIEPVE